VFRNKYHCNVAITVFSKKIEAQNPFSTNYLLFS
jgi:hypothetical protein